MSRGRLVTLGGRALCALCALCAWTASASAPASAAQVVILGAQGHAAIVNDPFLSGPRLEPVPLSSGGFWPTSTSSPPPAS